MIWDLRTFDLHIRRHYGSHAEVREFCASLYRARQDLGEIYEEQAWRRFAELLWKFHNRALASPLPLGHQALLSMSEERELVAAHDRIAVALPAATDLSARLLSIFEACRSSDLNPLGEKLLHLIRSSTNVDSVLLLTVHYEPCVRGVREELKDFPWLRILSPDQQQHQIEHLRRAGKYIVVGRISRIDPVLLRAPLAGC